MTADHLTNIEKFNADLWKVADELRANSNLASNEYFLPVMGLLFLRQDTNRYYEALAAIRVDHPKRIVEQVIRKLDNERIQAQIHADAAALERIYADDFIGVGRAGQCEPRRR